MKPLDFIFLVLLGFYNFSNFFIVILNNNYFLEIKSIYDEIIILALNRIFVLIHCYNEYRDRNFINRQIKYAYLLLF